MVSTVPSSHVHHCRKSCCAGVCLFDRLAQLHCTHCKIHAFLVYNNEAGVAKDIGVEKLYRRYIWKVTR